MIRSFSKYPWTWLLGLLLTVIPAIFIARSLTIQSDFKYLLPSNKPSVIELNRIVTKVGGISNLIIGIQCEDYKVTERFIEDLVKELNKIPSHYIRYIEYNVKDIRKFFTNHKYLYTDLEDLNKIHQRLAKKIRFEKLKRNPFYIALEEDKAEFDLSDIESKYKEKTSQYDDYKDGYFFSTDRKIAAVVIKPFGSSTGTGFTKELLAKVENAVNTLNPTSYHPSMTIHYTGKFKKTFEEYQQLILDMLETLGLCLILVAISLYLYFLRFRVIWMLALPLLVGVAWTFALTNLEIGYLNSQTAFLGSIIIGNGVNSGIILLARFLEERRKKIDIEQAIKTSVSQTWMGTLTAALTTSAGFAVLAVSEVKGFSQFGFIGGIGMTLCWIATYTVLPPLLVITERMWPMLKWERLVPKQWEDFLAPVGSLVFYFPKLVAVFGVLLLVSSFALISRFMPNSLEYDFSKLRNRTKNPTPIGQKSMNAKIDDIFKLDLSPVVILLESETQAPYACTAVMNRENDTLEEDKTIDSCKSLHSFLPDRQPEKLKVLKDIRKLLQDNSLNFIKGKYREELNRFKQNVNQKTLSLKDLPDSVSRNFRELDGRLGRMVYVYPRRTAKLSNGKKLIHFADVLSEIKLEDNSVVRMSGEAAIFADLLKAIKHDGPITTVLSYLVVSLLVLINFRKLRPNIYIVGGLTLGVIYMFGLQSLFEIKLNFFNFIALPVTFGIGVDYGVNLFQRYMFEGRGSVRQVIRTVGGAIILCSLTTLIGYATLLTAMNQALESFGWLALIGEMACLFAAMVVMPALLHAYDRRHFPDGPTGVGPAPSPPSVERRQIPR